MLGILGPKTRVIEVHSASFEMFAGKVSREHPFFLFGGLMIFIFRILGAYFGTYNLQDEGA